MAATKKKTQDLIDELNEIDLNMEFTNNFGWLSRLRAIRREAEALQGEHVINASIILGMVACLLHEDLEMRARHQNAINNAPSYPPAYYNFAQSLRRAGHYSEAFAHYEKTIILDPMDLEWYLPTIKNYLSAGRWDLALETILRFKNLTSDIPEGLEIIIDNLNSAIENYGIEHEKIAAIKKIADDFLRSKNIIESTNFDLRRFVNDGDFIYWPIFVHANREKIKQLNYEFSEVLAALDENIFTEKLILSFVEVH